VELQAHHCRTLLRVARSAIRASLAGAELPPLDTPAEYSDPLLHQPAGCFVTLHELYTHRLRGCIGRMEATDPLLQAVQRSAVNVLSDPRFGKQRVTLDDLPRLQIDISVLSPLKPVDHVLDFEPLTEGIYLTISRRSGCFLPQVARDTGWTREQLLNRLCIEKMGLASDAWRNGDARLMKFTTLIIGPEPFEETV
jgi:AmmeMemoRadiSam system protein A